MLINDDVGKGGLAFEGGRVPETGGCELAADSEDVGEEVTIF
jgi:hypothetical protein